MQELISDLANNDRLNIGIIGATGLVGSVMLDILDERHFPVGNLRLFGSGRSAGMPINWQDRTLAIEASSDADYSDMDIVFMSAGAEVSKLLAPIIAEQGAIVIDNSSAWRADPEVPLVVSEVNPEALRRLPKGIIANPNCTTMIAMPVLKPLHDSANLEAMVVTTMQAASGAGQEGSDELERQSWYSLRQRFGKDCEELEPTIFPEPIDGNVIPLRGKVVEARYTDEEYKLLRESSKILGIGNLLVSATCVSIPVYVGHSLSIEARFHKPINTEQAETLLRNSAGVRLVDIPTPLKASGGDVSLVGRIRRSKVFGDYGLSMFVTGDNLRKGAALNAVQIAELLV